VTYEKQVLLHHEDDTMPVMDVRWEWVSFPGYWRRDEHYEALKALREAGILTRPL